MSLSHAELCNQKIKMTNRINTENRLKQITTKFRSKNNCSKKKQCVALSDNLKINIFLMSMGYFSLILRRME